MYRRVARRAWWWVASPEVTKSCLSLIQSFNPQTHTQPRILRPDVHEHISPNEFYVKQNAGRSVRYIGADTGPIHRARLTPPSGERNCYELSKLGPS